MLKEIVILSCTLVVVSFAQTPNYILSNTIAPQAIAAQWAWGGNRPGTGGYWAWGPQGWTWVNPWANRPWYQQGNPNNLYPNYPYNPYYTTPQPGK